MNREEMLTFLKNEARGIAAMFGPNCETLVHDMTRPGHPILAIYNGTVTGREVGSTADIFGDIGNYDQTVYAKKDYCNQMVLSRDGRTLKSSTFNVVGEDYHFALGINMDITSMVRAAQVLSELRKHYADKLFETTVSRNVKLSEAPSFGLPVYYHEKRSKGAVEYLNIAKELAERI